MCVYAMKKSQWQLAEPIDAVVFDCDGTLSILEGINELAKLNGVGDEVCRLTDKAMSETGVTEELYSRRLSLVQPSKHQVEEIGQEYFNERSPDVLEVVRILQHLNKEIYIMSAGVNPAVTIFAELLGIPKSNVLAVDIRFDSDGHYRDYDKESPLTTSGGKRILTQKLREKHKTIMHVGDGMNDVAAKPCVTRFVGYGGAFYRESIENHCDFYIRSASLTPILPLLLTENESHNLSKEEHQYYNRGMEFIDSGEVLIR